MGMEPEVRSQESEVGKKQQCCGTDGRINGN
jgi:hypothetical protein